MSELISIVCTGSITGIVLFGIAFCHAHSHVPRSSLHGDKTILIIAAREELNGSLQLGINNPPGMEYT